MDLRTPSGMGPENAPDEWLEGAVRAVSGGRIAAVPFERLFGLAADADDPAAVERVVAAKGRDVESGRHPIPIAGPDRAALDRFVGEWTPLAERLAARWWPGPLTLLVPAAEGIPRGLVGAEGLVGVRVPGPCPAADLCRASGRALTATSANLAGGPDALDHEQVARLGIADLVVPGRVPGPPGTTVVDASGDRPVLVRYGILRIEEDRA